METFRFFFFFFYRNLSGIANEIDGNHSFLFSGWKYSWIASFQWLLQFSDKL